MSVTRLDIRNGIRSKMNAWPLNSTTLKTTIDATTQTVVLTSALNIEDRCLIEIGSEIIRVQTFATDTVSACIRGDRGSTKAAHNSGDAISLFPFWGWTDADLNRMINKAIDWLGEGMVWTLVIKSNTFLSTFKDFAAPTGAMYPYGDIVKRIEALDTDGVWKPILGWAHKGDRIIFNSNLTSDLQVRLWVQTRQARLADDQTIIDGDKCQEVLELYCAGRILEELLGNRSRYYDYSASLNDRASSADELQRVSYYFLNQAVILRDGISRPGLSGYASIQKG